MSETGNTFKKAPKRKAEKGRSVSVSAEQKAAYAEMIKEREQREEDYARHLRTNESPRR